MNEPRHITLHKRKLAQIRRLGDYAQPTDYHTFITESTIVHGEATSDVVIVYIKTVEENPVVLLDTLRHMDVPLTDRRFRGERVFTQWEIFGNRPRNERHGHPTCEPAALVKTQPNADRVLRKFGRVVTRYYRHYGGDVFTGNMEDIAGVRTEWRIDDTPFTSGIVNKDGHLPYHLDMTNFPQVWSGMLAFRHNMDGGHLSVPQYDVGFDIGDRSLLLFDGQSLVHGVTEMHPTGEDAYRYSVVYYSRAGMVKCQRPDREALRRIDG